MVDTRRVAAAVGAGLLAAGAAAGAGYYFYASRNAKRNRKIVADWANDLKGEVMRRAKRIGDLNRDALLEVIDNVAYAYETARNLDKRDVARAAGELKEHWQELMREARGTLARVARTRAPSKRSARSSSASAKPGRSSRAKH